VGAGTSLEAIQSGFTSVGLLRYGFSRSSPAVGYPLKPGISKTNFGALKESLRLATLPRKDIRMPETTGAFQYLGHLRRRMRVLFWTCGTAVLLSVGISLLSPTNYTATARILIDPPAGSDQRMGVNPMYLESLKTYEIIASGEYLFLQAAEHFGLSRSMPINQRSVITVRIPRNTRILELTATLPDAKKAHAFALYMAQQTVALSRMPEGETERDLIGNAEKELADARTRMENAEREWAELDSIPINSSTTRSMRVDVAEAHREAARDAFERAQRRAQEVRFGTGYRNERLTIIDPGVVPQRPSSPKTTLNALAALLVGLAGGLLYIILEFNSSVPRRVPSRRLRTVSRFGAP
jgi:capsular polysaccharide biosynthesis protein